MGFFFSYLFNNNFRLLLNMNCDVSKVESIKERINKARAFKEPNKSHLKQSYTPWCTGCRQ